MSNIQKLPVSDQVSAPINHIFHEIQESEYIYFPLKSDIDMVAEFVAEMEDDKVT